MNQVHAENRYYTKDKNGKKKRVKVNEQTGEMITLRDNFWKFDKTFHEELFKLSITHPLSASIMNFFITQMDGTNAIIISMEALGEVFGKSRATLTTAIKRLKKLNWLDIRKSGNMNIYCVNAEIIWDKSEDDVVFAKFNATVYISASEQKLEVQKEIHSKIKGVKN